MGLPAWLNHEYRPNSFGRCLTTVIHDVTPLFAKERQFMQITCNYPKWMHEEGGLMDESDQPVLNIQVVECGICGEELLNRLYRWTHRPGSSQTDHEPVPQPRTGQPVIPT